jgi:ABC-type uncharacterized transport system involved in gliding motility auxiliary subunit
MMNSKLLFSGKGLVITGVFLLLSVALISVFPRLRIDLTQDSLYTLADGTRNIVSGLEKPVDLLFFYSEEATADVPQLRTYGTRVQELLEEMAIASEGNVTYRLIDPVPFSEEEDLAVEYGVQRVPLSEGGEEVFFGIVALDPATVAAEDANAVEVAQAGEKVFKTIALVRPDQEEFLEYEVAKLITQVANPTPPVVGFLSTVPVDGGMNPDTMRPVSPLMIMDTIRQLYTTRRVAPDATSIDEDITILMLVHPQELSEQTQYAIDQFVLRGGKVLAFLDPNADSQAQPGQDGVPVARPNQASDLERLLSAWGVQFDNTKVVADREQALLVNLGDSSRPVTHYGMMGLARGSFAGDIVTTGLQVLNLSSAGTISSREGATTTFEPLVQSSADAGLMDAPLFKALVDPTILLDDFQATGERYTIAARISGAVQTAFPEGRPAAEEPAAESAPASADAGAAAEPTPTPAATPAEAQAPHLSESNGPVNIIVIADSDLLNDRLWVQIQSFFGQRIGQAFASNGDFIMNALDNLSGNAELVTIRSRGRYARPFLTVMELQREADLRLREEETQLLANLQQTEAQIAALSSTQDGNQLSEEQRAEIARFNEQQLETRRRLREVQLQLNQDIERLGSVLKFVNTALVPIVLIAVVLLLGWLRGRRRTLTVA